MVDSVDNYFWLLTGHLSFQTLSLLYCLLTAFVCLVCLLVFRFRNKMAAAQLVAPFARFADTHCSRFAIRYVESELWTHHRTCSIHVVCSKDGSHCRVCEHWSEGDWEGLETLLVHLAARQEKRRKAGKVSDTGSTSGDSFLSEGAAHH